MTEQTFPVFHEFAPSCYTPELLEEHLLGANNALCTMREEIMPDLKNEALALMSDYGYDTVQIIEHIFRSLEVWSDVHLKYLYDEADWAEAQILNKMECYEASKHFEDYMNPPIDCPMSDEDEITICLKAHEIPNGDCVDCTEPCCPQSFYGTP